MVAHDRECKGVRRPKQQRRCHLQECPSQWFMTEWSGCDQQCGQDGLRSRQVVCLRNLTHLSHDCPDDAPEASESCSVDNCHGEQSSSDEYQDDTEDDYNDEEYNEVDDLDAAETSTKAVPVRSYNKSRIVSNNTVPDRPKEEESCRDKFKNCNIVVQSRLCNYQFYQSNCCRSCARIKKKS